MTITIAPGDVFHLPIPRPDFGHIHVIITSINIHTGAFLCVPIDSWENNRLSDSTVILNPGDHPFIRKKSYVNYDKASIKNIDQLNTWIKNGDARKLDPISNELFEIIRLGIRKSENTDTEIIEFYNNCYL